MKYDIIYVVKNDCDGEELKYSIRSVVKNFPYRKICIVGGCPECLTADILMYDKQTGKTKWEKTMGSFKQALLNEDLTDDVWLFNDDFFVMDRITEPKNYFGGTLEKRVIQLRRSIKNSAYTNQLDALKGKLIKMNKDTLSFALHVPMLINRSKALQLFETFPKLQMFRSLYGNYYEIECTYMKDVKIYDLESVPNTSIISTSDESFKNGKVGEFIRACFTEPSKYEIEKAELLARLATKELYTEEGDEIHS